MLGGSVSSPSMPTDDEPTPLRRGVERFLPNSQQLSSTEHHEWATKMWHRMDRDGSGFITRGELDCEEFRSIIRAILAPGGGVGMGGAHYARAEMNMKEAISFCLRKADINCDNSISFGEFESFTWCLRSKDLARNTSHLIFALFDLNGDNRISQNEFREIFRFYTGRAPAELELQREWGRLDKAGEGRVTQAQYIRWLQTSANPVFRQHAPPVDESLESVDAMAKSPPNRVPRAGLGGRKEWNQRLAEANPNVRCPIGRRSYFSRPQSLPELTRYYKEHRGFRRHKESMARPEPRKLPHVLSTGSLQHLQERALPGGHMLNRFSGQTEAWEDHWQTPRSMKPRVRPGSMLLRTSEPPPKWMIEYKRDDE